MNIFKRLHNLWRLSEIELYPEEQNKKIWDTIKASIKSGKASVVDMTDPLAIDLGEDQI